MHWKGRLESQQTGSPWDAVYSMYYVVTILNAEVAAPCTE